MKSFQHTEERPNRPTRSRVLADFIKSAPALEKMTQGRFFFKAIGGRTN